MRLRVQAAFMSFVIVSLFLCFFKGMINHSSSALLYTNKKQIWARHAGPLQAHPDILGQV